VHPATHFTDITSLLVLGGLAHNTKPAAAHVGAWPPPLPRVDLVTVLGVFRVNLPTVELPDSASLVAVLMALHSVSGRVRLTAV
jgi:hypothetical protein